MIEITPLQPHEVEEARRVIYITAHAIFDSHRGLDETIADYRIHWPLRDIDDFQNTYNQGGAFLVLRDDGRIVGTGALKKLEEGVGEIKRLWLLKAYQGRGLGYKMMLRLLEAARDRGYAKVRLSTNPQYQASAIGFYKKMGFYDIPNYSDDLEDISLELALE